MEAKEKLYHKQWFMWLLLILLPPVGIIVMWVTKKEFTVLKKVILTVVFVIWCFLLLDFFSEDTDKELTNSDTVETSLPEHEYRELNDNNKELKATAKRLEATIEELEATNQELLEQIVDLEKTNTELQGKVDEAKPWFELAEMEQKEKEKELAKQKEDESIAAAEAAEAERIAQEEEEKKGYETGITFDQLARTPDDYEGKKVKFFGQVIQVIEGEEETQLRLAVDDDYNNVIYLFYESDLISSRVLEDDYITIMGISAGLLSYESTMGGPITIPAVIVDKIEL